ncbi:hypothetical protein HQ955_12660 [Enterococcus faecium]|nr:hypothetical protein [Enterococcus faecium]EME7096861.1 hypothetical protein [Enterococcus faecium]NTR92147.1 hypothetical protein [Enterococcus faecium]
MNYKKLMASVMISTTLLGSLEGGIIHAEETLITSSITNVQTDSVFASAEKEVNAFYQDTSFNKISDVYQHLLDGNDSADKAGMDWTHAYNKVMNLPNETTDQQKQKEELRKRIVHVLCLYAQQVQAKKHANLQKYHEVQYQLAEHAIKQLFSDESCTQLKLLPTEQLNELYEVAWDLTNQLPTTNNGHLKKMLVTASQLQANKIKESEEEQYKVQYYNKAEAAVKQLFLDDSCNKLANIDLNTLGEIYENAKQQVNDLPAKTTHQKDMKNHLNMLLDKAFKLAQ